MSALTIRNLTKTYANGVQALKGIDEWLEFYRRFWDQRFDKMGAYVARLQEQKKKKEKPE